MSRLEVNYFNVTRYIISRFSYLFLLTYLIYCMADNTGLVRRITFAIACTVTHPTNRARRKATSLI